MMDATPHSLIVRLRRPDDALAWERFVYLFTPLVDQWARRLGLQEADADDLVGEVFIVLVRRMPDFTYDPKRSFRAWLWTVTYRLWQRRVRVPRPLPLSEDVLQQLAAPEEPPPLDEVDYRHHIVGRAMQILKTDFAPATWRAFWAFAVEGRPAVEIARELGVSVNAIYLTRTRVLVRLRQELAGLLD